MIYATLIDGSVFEISKNDIETVLYNSAPFIPARRGELSAAIRTWQIIAITSDGNDDKNELDRIIESYTDENATPFYPQL